MKKKTTAALLLLTALLPGCARQTPQAAVRPEPKEQTAQQPAAEGAELYTLAESQEQAEEIAALYGIELVEYSFGVATFHTEEEPRTVVQRGRDNGWPEISVNGINHMN